MGILNIKFKTHLKCEMSSAQTNVLSPPPTAPSSLKKYIIENKLSLSNCKKNQNNNKLLIQKKLIEKNLKGKKCFKSTYLSLETPKVDGCGLASLRPVILKHKIKEDLPTKNKITEERQHMPNMKLLINNNKISLFKI